MANSSPPRRPEQSTPLRDRLIQGILKGIDHSYLNGHPVKRLPNNANLSFDYVEGESMCLNLDLKGICVSTGSACSSSNLEPSHVLRAMGVPFTSAHGSIRYSLSRFTTEDEIDYTLKVMPEIVERLLSISPFWDNEKQEGKPITL